MLSNARSCARCTVRTNKLKCQFGAEKGLLQGQARRTGGSCTKKPKLPDAFMRRSFLGKVWDEDCRLCDFSSDWLVWGNRVMFQEFCAQPEVTILHLGEDLSSCRRTERYCYIYSLRRNWGIRTLPLDCTIVSRLFLPCFCIPPLPWLGTVWICPLELREGLGHWSLFPADKKWGTRKGFVPERTRQGLAPFHFFWLSMAC